jgi:hypothetical protein
VFDFLLIFVCLFWSYFLFLVFIWLSYLVVGDVDILASSFSLKLQCDDLRFLQARHFPQGTSTIIF